MQIPVQPASRMVTELPVPDQTRVSDWTAPPRRSRDDRAIGAKVSNATPTLLPVDLGDPQYAGAS